MAMDQQISSAVILAQLMRDETQHQPLGGPELVSVCDHQSGQFMLVAVGWQRERHMDHIIFHARLLNGFVVIETDNTEEGLKSELVEAGIPASQIVFGAEYRPAMAEAMTA